MTSHLIMQSICSVLGHEFESLFSDKFLQLSYQTAKNISKVDKYNNTSYVFKLWLKLWVSSCHVASWCFCVNKNRWFDAFLRMWPSNQIKTQKQLNCFKSQTVSSSSLSRETSRKWFNPFLNPFRPWGSLAGLVSIQNENNILSVFADKKRELTFSRHNCVFLMYWWEKSTE